MPLWHAGLKKFARIYSEVDELPSENESHQGLCEVLGPSDRATEGDSGRGRLENPLALFAVHLFAKGESGSDKCQRDKQSKTVDQFQGGNFSSKQVEQSVVESGVHSQACVGFARTPEVCPAA